MDALVKRMTREAAGALPGACGQLSAFGGTTVMRSGSPPCLQAGSIRKFLQNRPSERNQQQSAACNQEWTNGKAQDECIEWSVRRINPIRPAAHVSMT